MNKRVKRLIFQVIAVLVTLVAYIVPFYFIILTACKNKKEASWLNLSLPTEWKLFENIKEVLTVNDGMIIRAFFNSLVLTVCSVLIIVVVTALLAFVMQRRNDRSTRLFSLLILAGLIVPSSVVPTYWVLDFLHISKTIVGLIIVEVALNISFATILYRGFMGSIPQAIDEAAIIDGCGTGKLFMKIILPLLKPVTATVAVVSTLHVYNDFVNPLYYLPGAKNATIQLSIYYFSGQYGSDWNLVFADILLISIPVVVMYVVFNKQIVEGMVAGSVKG
ncbi:carbohydrate ABC transporter permease [Cuneatibacter caecimuris]|uniref:Raffinose/stachyose/melibiose transport system permease protein n=1 Tax=Cuneatibacter caecimuris TaxID=1796618 RepID=A0A4Q7PIW3_9FIRM|nr:carbohydrate ABC transporter permease [Cuneatibacter caecimuris]RZT00572.1 raffinose/stachyose/melibiose transport system permease protein [Cuneatibacter caecimuris]